MSHCRDRDELSPVQRFHAIAAILAADVLRVFRRHRWMHMNF